MARLLAFIIFMAALSAGGYDLFLAVDKRADFQFHSIGDYWYLIDPASINALYPFFEGLGLWEITDYVYEFLLMPAAPTLGVISVVLWILGGLFKRRRVASPKPGKVRVAKDSTRARRNISTQHAGMHREAHTARSGPVRRMR